MNKGEWKLTNILHCDHGKQILLKTLHYGINQEL